VLRRLVAAQRQQHELLKVHGIGAPGRLAAEGLLQGFSLHRAIQPLIGIEVHHPVVLKPLDGCLLGGQLLLEAELPQPFQLLHRQHAPAEPGFGHGAGGVVGAVVNHHHLQPFGDPEGQVLAQQIGLIAAGHHRSAAELGWWGVLGSPGDVPQKLQTFPAFERLQVGIEARHRVLEVIYPLHEVADHIGFRIRQGGVSQGVDPHAALVDHAAWNAHKGAVAFHIAHHHRPGTDAVVGADGDGTHHLGSGTHHNVLRRRINRLLVAYLHGIK